MELPAVSRLESILNRLLEQAQNVKQSHGFEPTLTAQDFNGKLEEIGNDVRQYAVIEAACRKVFHSTVVNTSINDPAFVRIWNLLDLLLILGDSEQCDPALAVWLIEELLESQTIDGCRTVLDYFESRREKISGKHFEKRKLVVLRSCNELLRRLSRAEDTVFCGRVFIFLFQYFPLGDKSSVNLRGEYHVENKTIYDKSLQSSEDAADAMVIDSDKNSAQEIQNGRASTPKSQAGTPADPKSTDVGVKAATSAHQKAASAPMTLATLYPIFWSLQDSFSDPTRLFATENFQSFKSGLQATIDKFREVTKQKGNVISYKLSDEGSRGVKRKRDGEKADIASGFTPKYLTSHDLFELEISDLAFRRYVLVQALILIDFLLSLSPASKAKAEATSNKSISYSYVLSEEDAAWAIETKTTIASFIREPTDGPLYYRMVETVLSRDKNWVRWKAEGCPPMERPAITIEEWQQALGKAKQICQNKKLRRVPVNALDVSFLDDPNANGFEALKDPKRFQVPSVEDFQKPIMEDELEIDMPTNEATKEQAINSKQSKTWRALRLAARDRFEVLESVEANASDLRPLFEPRKESGDGADADEATTTQGDDTPHDDSRMGGQSVDVPPITILEAKDAEMKDDPTSQASEQPAAATISEKQGQASTTE